MISALEEGVLQYGIEMCAGGAIRMRWAISRVLSVGT